MHFLFIPSKLCCTLKASVQRVCKSEIEETCKLENTLSLLKKQPMIVFKYLFVQTYHVNYYHRQWWNDNRVKFNASYGEITLSTPPEDIIWVPDITFVNANDVDVVHTAQRLIIRPNGDIYTSQRYNHVFFFNS